MLTSEIIGQRIREVRESRDLNQIQLCKKLENLDLNISRETLSKIENGNRSLAAIELKAICEILSIAAEELLEDSEENIVTLFRRRLGIVPQTISEVEDLQEIIKNFITQKKLYTGENSIKKKGRLWEVD